MGAASTGTGTSTTTPTARYYARDQIGSVMQVTDANGNNLASLQYDAYGQIQQLSGTLPQFSYAGMFYHAPSGLYLTHYRAYDPFVGRWVSRDPIAESGGINLAAYVGGNPVNRVDPLGLMGQASGGIGAGHIPPHTLSPAGIPLEWLVGGMIHGYSSTLPYGIMMLLQVILTLCCCLFANIGVTTTVPIVLVVKEAMIIQVGYMTKI